MPCYSPTNRTKYVVLEGIHSSNFRKRFYSKFRRGDDSPCYSSEGERWYSIVCYTDTEWEAQKALYGGGR